MARIRKATRLQEEVPSGRDQPAPEFMPPVPESSSDDRPPVPPPALGKTYRSSEAGARIGMGSIPGVTAPAPVGRAAVPPGMPAMFAGPRTAPAGFGHGAFAAPPHRAIPPAAGHGGLTPAPALRPAFAPSFPAARHPSEAAPPTPGQPRQHPPHQPPEPRTES